MKIWLHYSRRVSLFSKKNIISIWKRRFVLFFDPQNRFSGFYVNSDMIIWSFLCWFSGFVRENASKFFILTLITRCGIFERNFWDLWTSKLHSNSYFIDFSKQNLNCFNQLIWRMVSFWFFKTRSTFGNFLWFFVCLCVSVCICVWRVCLVSMPTELLLCWYRIDCAQKLHVCRDGGSTFSRTVPLQWWYQRLLFTDYTRDPFHHTYFFIFGRARSFLVVESKIDMDWRKMTQCRGIPLSGKRWQSRWSSWFFKILEMCVVVTLQMTRKSRCVPMCRRKS